MSCNEGLTISVDIPVYNERAYIREIIQRVKGVDLSCQEFVE